MYFGVREFRPLAWHQLSRRGGRQTQDGLPEAHPTKNIFWLVVEPPIWTILVKIGNDPQIRGENEKYLKPPTSQKLEVDGEPMIFRFNI